MLRNHMQSGRKFFLFLLVLIILPPMIIYIVHAHAAPGYWISSSYKLIFLSPLVIRRWIRGVSWRRALTEGFNGGRFYRHWRATGGITIGLSAIYLCAYIMFRGYFDAGAVADQLAGTTGTSPETILWIGLFIIVINSVIEEYFWRGFLFRELNDLVPVWLAHLLTGIGFSLHHAVFYIHWFNGGLIALATVGLFGFSVIMNIVFIRFRDLFSCWVIHAAVDVVQIYIGIRLIGISF